MRAKEAPLRLSGFKLEAVVAASPLSSLQGQEVQRAANWQPPSSVMNVQESTGPLLHVSAVRRVSQSVAVNVPYPRCPAPRVPRPCGDGRAGFYRGGLKRARPADKPAHLITVPAPAPAAESGQRRGGTPSLVAIAARRSLEPLVK
ncbi:hypothetical protein SKAU_G00084600 [Synaphobranchus kaupii]|uniref:Uncharacterized protein n=1 Tax=Synaphobranchus kaupii TaxID=118154 RepID=A0A9Q1J4T3_SYNKA|nr:hypothetical protein SKAU_G00084600 [Synaphobranchus kaupii]